ncbi:hypothetical protein AMECASPLE_027979 [Ameca splendens]|uniref:Uncharacterized protein n=1 Tax=Ameca splendens TaxID=208324 RepID=A0ABV0YGU0_9TELE
MFVHYFRVSVLLKAQHPPVSAASNRFSSRIVLASALSIFLSTPTSLLVLSVEKYPYGMMPPTHLDHVMSAVSIPPYMDSPIRVVYLCSSSSATMDLLAGSLINSLLALFLDSSLLGLMAPHEQTACSYSPVTYF